jgi:hypothetical protein
VRRLLAIIATLGIVLAACSDADETRAVDGGLRADDPAAPGADGLPVGPSALTDIDADEFPEPLVDIDRILSGGPPPDGIPPIDDPQYTPASEVDFLDDVEPVLVVEVDGEVKVFPVQIMTWHEIVNDTIGGVPVTVSYCPLCNSAITYDRRIDTEAGEAVLDFGTSGLLFNSALVMYDRQTESLWSHFTGEAVVGVLTGTELETYPTSTVGWADALAAHPDAPVLNRDTGFDRAYGQNPYTGYDDVNTSPFLFDGETDGRLAAKERVIGIESGDDAVAVRTEQLGLHDVADVELGDEQLTVWRAPGTSSALDTAAIEAGRDIGATGVFERTVDGQLLTFSPAEEGDLFVDAETGSTWDILGRATGGPLAGTELTAVEHVDTFWFAWAAFLPDTTIVPQP